MFFITTCVALTVLVAAWAVRNGQWLFALVALAGGATLIVYLQAFLRKARQLGLQ